MVDGRLPVGRRDRPALVVGDRDERHLGILVEQRPHVRRVQPAVQGRDARAWVAPQQREVQVVAVEVDDVEAGDVVEDQLHQPDVVRQRLAAVWSRHSARGQAGTSCALVCESPLANSVTSCPSRTSSSVR